MKIAVSATSKIPSSTANSIQVLMACQGLVQNGQEIQLWVPGSGSPAFETLRGQYCLTCADFPIIKLPSRRWLRRLDFSWQAVSAAQRWGADLVYTWTIQAALIAARRGIPVVFEAHDLPTGTLGKRWFREFAASKTPKRFAFITRALQDRVQQLYPAVRDADCVIAPNGINPEDYADLPGKAEAKEELGFSSRPIASCSGHLYQGRGVNLFLEIARSIPEIDFYWFGGTLAEVNFYRERVIKETIPNVVFTGLIPKADLPLAQAASDYLLMPYDRCISGSSGGNSAEICSPMKMFEYLAAGRPILASNLPVFREVLDDETALFCEPEEPGSWIAALRSLLTDSQKAASMAKAAHEKSTRYTWSKRANKILESIKGAL